MANNSNVRDAYMRKSSLFFFVFLIVSLVLSIPLLSMGKANPSYEDFTIFTQACMHAVTSGTNDNYRYLYVAGSWDDNNHNKDSTADIANLDLQEPDTTPPTLSYPDFPINTTRAGQNCKFQAILTDDETVDWLKFQHNNTGVWSSNITIWSGDNTNSSREGSYTLALNSTASTYFAYRWFGADTAGNEVSSGTKGFFTTDKEVARTSAENSVAYPFQRKIVYGANRYWAFYTDGDNLVCKTSVNGTYWDGYQVLGESGSGLQFAVCWQNPYISYVRSICGKGDPIYYCRCYAFENGTLHYPIGEKVAVPSDSNLQYLVPTIEVDSLGYPWIGYRVYNFSTSKNHAWVTKSSTNNGYWTTATGFPYKLVKWDVTSCWTSTPVRLTNQKMACIYVGDVIVKAYCRIWNGSAFGDEENATTSNCSEAIRGSTCIAENDDVHLVINAQTTFDIRYVKRTYSNSSWSTEVVVDNDTNLYSAPVLTKYGDTLRCFWALNTTDHIYYRQKQGVTWSDRIDWADESSDGLFTRKITALYEASENKSGVVYQTNTPIQNTIKFANPEHACMVNYEDLFRLADAYGSHGPDFNYPGEPESSHWDMYCDFNGDNRVNYEDLFFFADHYEMFV